MNSEMIAEQVSNLMSLLVSWAPKLIGAILVLIIGLWIIGRLMGVIQKAMEKSGLDKDVVPFLTSLISVLFKIMLLISVAGMVGIETTAFVGLLAAGGLAIGMALQGTLGHFASGVLILIFKPYRVGDLVDVQGIVGTVREIQVFNTIIDSLENKKVIIPNGIATSGIMTNLSATDHLRVDLNIAMPYEEDFDKVQKIVLDALRNTPHVLDSPEPVCEIEKFDAHNVLLAVRPFAKCENYWDVYFGSYKNIKAALGKANIKVAYPKRELINAKSPALN